MGGKQAAATNKAKHGADFYRIIGSKGGKAPSRMPKGFAANRELARIAGAKGGRVSSRKGIRNGEGTSRHARTNRQTIIQKLVRAFGG